MAIANKFLYFSTKAAYTAAVGAQGGSLISGGSIVFVDQPYVAQVGEPGDSNYAAAIPAERFIETHGKKYYANQAADSIKAAIEALDVTDLTNSDSETRGVTITLNEVDGKVTSLAISDLAGAKLGAYTKGDSDAAIAVGDTIAAALAKLENQIAAEATARANADTAINDKIGTGFDSTNTVAKAISDEATARGNADTAIQDQIGTGFSSASGNTIAERVVAAEGAITTLKGNNTVTGSVDKKIKDAIDALDYTIESHTAGKAVTAVSETDGVIAVTEGNIKSDYVDYTPQVVTAAEGTEGQEGYKPAVYDTNKTNIQETTKEIYGKIRDLTSSFALTLIDANNNAATTVKADGTTYKLKQGTNVVAQFNIMKETFLDTNATGLVWFKTAPSTFSTTGNTEGESSPATYSTWTDAEKKAAKAYLKLVMRTDADGDPGTTGDTTVNAYIPAESLIATYTGATASDSVITVAVSDANVITATIGDGTVALAKLTTAAQNTLSSYKTTISTTVSGGDHITITKTAGNESNGTGDSYAITESNIADADDLTAEITARKAVDGQSGDTYTANSGTNYISNATSLNNADVLLDTQAKANADNISAEVTRAEGAETAIDAIVGLTKDANSETRTYTNTGNYIGKLTSPNTNTIKSDISALDTQAKANADAIGVLNGNDSTSGSVAKSIKDAIEGLDAEKASSNGAFVNVTVTEANGKVTAVSVAEGDADDIKISSSYAKATGTISAVAANDSIETAIEKIDGKLDNLNSASPFEYANSANKATKLKDSGLSAQHDSEVAVGKYNVSHTGNDDSAKTQFSVGIGTEGTGNAANGLEVRANGDIYINLSLPTGTNGALENNYILLQDLLENEINWYEG